MGVFQGRKEREWLDTSAWLGTGDQQEDPMRSSSDGGSADPLDLTPFPTLTHLAPFGNSAP